MNEFEQFLERTKGANIVPVMKTLTADLLTPLAVYLKLAADAKNSFLLESVEGGEALSRYSFIGAEPEMIVSGGAGGVTVTDARGSHFEPVPMLEYLKRNFADQRVAADPELPSFIGGAIGYLGFSCTGWFEPSLRELNTEAAHEAELMFYRTVIGYDHARQQIKIVSLVMIDETDGTRDGLQRAFNSAREKNSRVIAILENDATPFPAPSHRSAQANVESNWKKRDFETAVRQIKEMIAAGECYQVVLSQCFSKPTAASPVAIYRAVRSLNPSPYMFLLQIGQKAVIGASPEMLVRLRNDRLEYRPIAGTRQRGADTAADERLAEEMCTDQKEVAEHLMLVDLGRNDLGRVSEYGSVKVEKLMSVEKYSHVQHMVSFLSSQLRKGTDRFDAFGACFPAGTVSGAPKMRAIEIIRSLEPSPRSEYAGAVGYFDYGGNMDTCIAIRTLVLQNGVARVQSGAGIVADSVPEMEYLESKNKAQALLAALEIAEGSNHNG